MNHYHRKVKSARNHMTLLLAGDIGATKTQLGVFEGGTYPPIPRAVERFTTGDFDELPAMVDIFLEDRRESFDAACFGVAGPVRDQTTQLTNIPWSLNADDLARRLDIPHVRLINDLAATGCAVDVLRDDQLEVLQRGDRDPRGNAALIAPGTGLGEALLLNMANRLVPMATEAGHADFAARTSRELALVEALVREKGRVSNEDVLAGPGLVNLYRFTHGTSSADCRVGRQSGPGADPAVITASGLEGHCPPCVETLELYVSALGAEAGNLGLRAMATGGVYLGGGIPRKILPALRTPLFLDAFRAKAPMLDIVARMPVTVITEPGVAVLGAAIAAQQLLSRGTTGQV